ncbi:MAG: glycosyltransferase [Nitrospiraceae bacterium]|nr:glycosyltransferase [Nitrospiraceae bacterium]
MSIIVPCYNSADTLGETLESLWEQAWPGEWEVIVADNGSTDSTKQVLETYVNRMSGLRMIDASGRRGPSYARNCGVKAALGEVVLFCDADDVPADGWAAAMAEALLTNDFVACRLDTELLNPAPVRASRGNTQAWGLQRFAFLPFGHAGAGTLGIKRFLHEAVGGFDESLPICEDVDYCMKVQQRGVGLQFVSSAVIHYRLRTTPQHVYRQASQYAKYEVYLYTKYAQAGSMSEMWRWRKYFQAWWLLLGRAPELLRSSTGKTLLLWRLGRLMGSLKGSIRFGGPPVMVE